jgi:hypothetical protein
MSGALAPARKPQVSLPEFDEAVQHLAHGLMYDSESLDHRDGLMFSVGTYLLDVRLIGRDIGVRAYFADEVLDWHRDVQSTLDDSEWDCLTEYSSPDRHRAIQALIERLRPEAAWTLSSGRERES